MNGTRRSLLAIVLTGGVLVTGCAPSAAVVGTETKADEAAPSGSAVTVENCGTELSFPSAPKRVLAIKSTSIEMMLALGLEDRLVGVAFPDGPYSAEWAPRNEPTVISDRLPSREALLALSPDLVYAGWESNVTAEGVGDRADLAGLGIASFISPAACQAPEYQPDPLDWEDLWQEIALVGDIFDVPSRAAALVSAQQERLAAVDRDERSLTALWYSSGSDTPFIGAGKGSPQLVMDAVGLQNIAQDIPMTWSSYSWEAAVAADPDVIVLVDSTWGSTEKKIAQLESDPTTSTMTAVREQRYLVVPFAAGEAGVRSVEAVERLAEQLRVLHE